MLEFKLEPLDGLGEDVATHEMFATDALADFGEAGEGSDGEVVLIIHPKLTLVNPEDELYKLPGTHRGAGVAVGVARRIAAWDVVVFVVVHPSFTWLKHLFITARQVFLASHATILGLKSLAAMLAPNLGRRMEILFLIHFLEDIFFNGGVLTNEVLGFQIE